jgi:hypothetical protein
MRIDRYAALLALAAIPFLSGLPGTAPDLTPPPSEQASQSARAGDANARSVAAAKAYLATLDEKQRAKASVELNPTTRVSWSNLPTGIAMQNGALERNGLKLGALTPVQQEAALALVAAPLSQSGFQKVMNIVNADEDLEQSTAPKRPADSRIRFGRAEYYVAILGTPSVSDPWMIQFGGHHLAINVTMVGKSNVLTPSHTGAQPARYTLEGRTIRPLGNENDKGFALVNALDPARQKQAILTYQIADTVWGPGTEGKVIQPEGVRVSSFNEDERAKLLDLVSEWVGILNDESAALKMAEIKANLAETWFAWSGPTTNGSGAYFRVQGPTVMIEYAPQGKGANTDHIHTFYRDPTNDYGAKITKSY